MSSAEIWSQREVVVNLPDGTKDFVRFAFDSETSLAHVLRFVRTMPEGEKALENALRGMTVELSQALEASGMTQAQFAKFGLRRDIPSKGNRTELRLIDLSSNLLAKMVEDNENLYQKILALLQTAFRKKSWPLRAEDDGGFPEIRHASSESSPRAFRDLVEKYHNAIQGANTHFHVSLPSEVPVDSLVKIVRAIETRIVLRFLADNNPGEIRHLYESSLKKNPRRVLKSIVAFQVERWTDPKPAHDIEIRHYLSLASALTDVALTAHLGRDYSKLKDFNVRFDERLRLDPQFGNATNALAYAGEALRTSPRKEDHELGEVLQDYATQFRQAKGQPSPGLREKLSLFLTKNLVFERLDAQVFLD